MVGTNDLERSVAFYGPLFEVMGLQPCYRDEKVASWGRKDDPLYPQFFTGYPFNGDRASVGNGGMAAFRFESRTLIDHLYQLALSNGGSDEGPPGLRPQYSESFYGAYVRDPDGNKLAFVSYGGAPVDEQVWQQRLTVHGPVVLATHNRQKLAAIAALLEPWGVEVLSAAQFDCDSPEETGATIAENAILKARFVAKATGHAALSDDSGFAIAALNGLPGAAAIDWAGPERDFELALARVDELLTRAGRRDGPAAVESCIALALPDGRVIAEEARTTGELVWPPRGPTDGYLSIFAIEGDPLTVSEHKAALGAEGQVDGQVAVHADGLGYAHRELAIKRLLARVDLPKAPDA